MFRSLACAAAMLVALMFADRADAQFVTYYSPVVAAPTPVQVVAYRQPVVYPAPVAYRVARPVVTVAPVAYTRTRYRPFFGGAVTRVRYGYAPVSYYGW